MCYLTYHRLLSDNVRHRSACDVREADHAAAELLPKVLGGMDESSLHRFVIVTVELYLN